MSSSARTTLFPRGDATHRIQPYGVHDHIGSVDIGTLTIQSTSAADLYQLAEALTAAADMVALASREVSA